MRVANIVVLSFLKTINIVATVEKREESENIFHYR